MKFKQTKLSIMNDTLLASLLVGWFIAQLIILTIGIYLINKHHGSMGEYSNLLSCLELISLIFGMDVFISIFSPACIIDEKILKVYRLSLRFPSKIQISNIKTIEIGKKVYLYYLNSNNSSDGIYVNLRVEDIEKFTSVISEKNSAVKVVRI